MAHPRCYNTFFQQISDLSFLITRQSLLYGRKQRFAYFILVFNIWKEIEVLSTLEIIQLLQVCFVCFSQYQSTLVQKNSFASSYCILLSYFTNQNKTTFTYSNSTLLEEFKKKNPYLPYRGRVDKNYFILHNFTFSKI